MRKGEVWIIEVPGIDGHEQRGLRPAIFIADTKSSMVIVIPCTSNLQSLRFSFTLVVEPSPTNGLDTQSIAMIFQLRAIDKKRLVKKIGKVDTKIIKKIDLMLKRLLSL